MLGGSTTSSPSRALVAASLILGCAAVRPTSSETTRPSILLIVADDQGQGELGRKGHPWIKTPALDAMAEDGLVLERFYAAAPVCSPTRASLLTGRHPNRVGTFSWGYELPGVEVTFAELLRDAGYATGHFGKWHLGSVRAGATTSPGAQGFETWASSPNFFDLDPLLSVGGEVVASEGEGSDVVTARAIEFMRAARAQERPFVAVVWFGSPHVPHAATPEDLEAFAAAPEAVRAYCAEIAAIDRNVAELRSELRALGVAESTLVWYTSDNGPRAPGPAAEVATGGLRGDKGTLWEGGIRVPCLLEWPGTIVPRESSALAGTVDVFPTVLELAGVPLPEGRTLDGASLAALIGGEAYERADGLGFWTLPIDGRVQHADRILQQQRAGEVSPEETPPEPDLALLEREPLPGRSAWIAGNDKLHAIPADTGVRYELYDLARDPAERIDLALLYPERVAKMRETLAAWQRRVADEALQAAATSHP